MRQARSADIYSVVERWVEVALKGDGSLFTPGVPIWSAPNLEDLFQRYNLRPDSSGGSFESKLRNQLDAAADPSIQLMAELLFVEFLIVDDITGPSKRASIGNVLSWMANPAAVPAELDDVLGQGIAAGGLAFKTWRWAQAAFIVSFARRWKQMPADDRVAALQHPWHFKSALWAIPIDSAFAQREALLHLVFPDTFEDIVSREHKSRLRESFDELVSAPSGDVDRDLVQIRAALSQQYGKDFSFYDPEVWPRWNPVATEPKPWDEFVRWAQKCHEWEGFDEDEYTYKLRDSEKVAKALEAAQSGSAEWLALATDALKSTNLVRWQAWDNLLPWWEQHPNEGRAMLVAVQGGGSLLDRLKGFIDRLPSGLLAGADLLRVVSFFMMGSDPTSFPPMAATPLARACKLTGYPAPSSGADEARRYRHGLAFLDRLIEEGERRGLKLRDRLDAQSVMWAVTENDPPPTWSEQDKATFLAWRSGEPLRAPIGRPVTPEPAAPRTLQQLADELFVPEDFLDKVVSLLREKGRRQVILYGPPGTGKTYIARRLAKFLAPEPDRRAVVQFHPSYSYEDFVQGYRPVNTEDGRLGYELRPGPLLRLARRAQEHQEEHVLLIDEVNRGNLPRILGELLFALEYRDEPVGLMYGEGEELVLPRNLLILGTMNTADKSIGLIDAALRRRFHFVPLFPGEGPLIDLLPQWLDRYVPEMRHVADIVDRLNAELRRRVGRHLQVGHSYFLRDDLSEDVLARVWEADIMPFLEDQFFGRDEDLTPFTLERLREAPHEDAAAAGMEADTDASGE